MMDTQVRREIENGKAYIDGIDVDYLKEICLEHYCSLGEAERLTITADHMVEAFCKREPSAGVHARACDEPTTEFDGSTGIDPESGIKFKDGIEVKDVNQVAA